MRLSQADALPKAHHGRMNAETEEEKDGGDTSKDMGECTG